LAQQGLQTGLGRREVRALPKDVAILLGRFVTASELRQDVGQVAPGFDETRSRCQGLLEMVSGALGLRIGQDLAETVVGLR
jgi:hypothetical protein